MIKVVILEEYESKKVTSPNYSTPTEISEADIVVTKRTSYEIIKNRNGPTGKIDSLVDLTVYL